jgi:hypothetical protein
MYVSMPITNQTMKKDDVYKISLLKLDTTLAERERVGWSWAWASNVFAALFTLTQAIGTVVIYARRLEDTWAKCLGFDHRIGALGIASTVCGVFSILALLLRFEWNVAHALHSSTEKK